MLSTQKIAKRFVCFWPRGARHVYGAHQNINSHTQSIGPFFCTFSESPNADTLNVVESPELPNWVKFCEHENPSVVEADDDFVLPKISILADTQKLHADHGKHVKRMVGEIVDSDVNKLAEVLKRLFESPTAVGYALAEYNRIDLSESLVEKILLKFCNDWIPAFGFFKWAKGQTDFMPSENCYNLMVDILGKLKKFELMWELLEEMHKLGGLVSIVTMSKVIRRLCRARKCDDAVEAFKKFEHFGLIKDTSAMNILMDSLVKERDVERAQNIFLEYKDEIALNSRTFNILIHGWCKAKKYNEARKVMEEMEKHGCLPDVASYTCFVESYCQAKDFRKVDEILNEMQQKGCPPNTVTYTIVMLALGKAKEINESLEIYEKMKQNCCVPDVGFYSALIFIMSTSGRFKDACDIFNDMPKQNVAPDVLTYNTMISAACHHSKEEYALELLKEMEEKSCTSNVTTYTPLLKMCCVKKRMKVLKYLIDDMFLKNVSVDFSTYCLLVDGLCKSGKLEHACSFFELMVLKGMVPGDNRYLSLIKKLEQKGMTKAKQQIESLMSKAKLSPA
ncbi:pentatricopeptide repeat-containing protein At3g22670, mitochondrial [Spinacia oleracea]|uniref:Pentatricopeptide repeat-containing protein At3g22670, mitochondrial n=1 Tax=Spinacia oleracea TaxID=3562 RepID=A0ABM3QIL8_SPIOL|nr:pentatricopeptide repeat-containing protein At3g22670, mitochondrial-like [Spinacia oleracea]XP_056683200.1 pentatricopeptide repeat-containing protein At3g22670, mitochondrial-like [Spinacia oleracea]XP_056683201.1 pentatricopeptide repeat-containing protein At3g22670, mitochondrial-like [Spinacia oleracea]XP_056683202.1 pentatricopeptide repeat-containing protein At3g22670, mitochondrial-like [Spinacia oleracea]